MNLESEDPPVRWRMLLTPGLARGLVLVTLVLALLGIWRVSSTSARAEIPQSDSDPAIEATRGYGLTDQKGMDEDEEESATVVIHVVGAVNSPGVVEIPLGSRVIDALNAAGGATQEAGVSSLNLAAIAADGSQVYVPVVGETPPVASAQVSGGASQGSGGTAAGGCVDLNVASETELQELDGVGPKIAARIVQWRESAGTITSAEQLIEVPGIGPVLSSRIAAGTCQ